MTRQIILEHLSQLVEMLLGIMFLFSFCFYGSLKLFSLGDDTITNEQSVLIERIVMRLV